VRCHAAHRIVPIVEDSMTSTLGPASAPPASSSPSGSLLTAGFLALGTFAIGTEGFMIAPLLPRMAADFGMSAHRGQPGDRLHAGAGHQFAHHHGALGPAQPAPGTHRRHGHLTAANVLAAFSTGFGSLLASRLLMAVAAGLYTPNANALAGAIVKPEQRGRALAIVSGGMTIAIALGLPLGSVVGHAFGWRATFGAVAVMGAVAVAGIWMG
jgi:predicted MFS family arabinose efflux permease